MTHIASLILLFCTGALLAHIVYSLFFERYCICWRCQDRTKLLTQWEYIRCGGVHKECCRK